MTAGFDPMKKRESSSQTGSYSFNFARVKNPVLEQVRDTDLLTKMFTDFKVIPYSGTDNHTSDQLLNLFNKMRAISPTLGACWFSIKSFVFQGRLMPIPFEDPDFDFGEEVEPLSREQKIAYKENLLKKISYNTKGAKSLTENCFDDIFDNGNYWLEVQLAETGGEKSALINYHHSLTVRKIVSSVDMVAISDSWDPAYVLANRPDVLPLYPNYGRGEDGVLRTMIHCQFGNFVHYGRPVWIAAWLNGYREYQDTDYLIKAADKMFTGQVIIEYEGEPDEEYDDYDDDQSIIDEGKNLMQKIERNFTAQADNPQTVLVMERPHKASPALIKELSVNLNENFFEKEDDKNRRKLFENLSWSERLLGNNVGNAFSDEGIIKELKVKDTGVLKTFRDKVVEGLNVAIHIIDEFINDNEYSGISLAYSSLFGDEKSLKSDQVKKILDSIGVAVRAGTLTPTMQDEVKVRDMLSLDEMPQEAIDVWKEDKVRTPITLKGEDERDDESALNNAKTEGDE